MSLAASVRVTPGVFDPRESRVARAFIITPRRRHPAHRAIHRFIHPPSSRAGCRCEGRAAQWTELAQARGDRHGRVACAAPLQDGRALRAVHPPEDQRGTSSPRETYSLSLRTPSRACAETSWKKTPLSSGTTRVERGRAKRAKRAHGTLPSTRTTDSKRTIDRRSRPARLSSLLITTLTPPTLAPRPQVIPSLQGDASSQSPPDLPSFIFKERIVYLGMTLVPSVTELILAELLYLQYEDNAKPIYLYINSTGTSKEGQKYGYDTEAFAIYDTMKYVNPPVHTVAVGTAWGEAAMLLACGEKGHRAALPSASIMIKQPINAFRGQATELEIQRKEIRNTKRQTLELLSKGIGKDYEEIEKDINRPKYFNPWEAVDYGIIDQVLDGKH
jgi:ATP-dependent Clp protease protease subunit